MTRRNRVWVLIAVGAAALALTAQATPASAKTFAGVVSDVPSAGVVSDVPGGTHIRSAPQAHVSNLLYGGGAVLHSNRTHVIFWQPAGSGLGYEPGYQSLVTGFLAAVAADSRSPTNVYGLTGQYTDAGGPAAYDSSYGGAVVDTNPLPSNGCLEPLVTGPDWAYCLSDQQIETEIENVVASNHLPTSGQDVYFLVTPDGLGSCQTTGPSNCALGGTAASGYCGYHSSTPDNSIIYAVIPYNAIGGHCQSSNPRPNGNPADLALSTLSHEHSEMVTDPYASAWIDGSGLEDGDLCITQYGPALGGTGASAYNEAIGGGHYYLQEEWSNDDGSCQPRDESYPIWFGADPQVAVKKPLSFTGHAGDPDGSIVAYDWYFGDGATGHKVLASHTFKKPGTYRVVLRTTDRDGNRAFYARDVRVTLPAAKRS